MMELGIWEIIQLLLHDILVVDNHMIVLHKIDVHPRDDGIMMFHVLHIRKVQHIIIVVIEYR